MAKRNVPKPPRDEEETVPDDIEAFRAGLIRKIATILRDWRRCGEPSCRRARRCVSPRMSCARLAPARTLTPEREARAIASLQKMLRQRAAECAAQDEAPDAPPAPSVTPPPSPRARR